MWLPRQLASLQIAEETVRRWQGTASGRISVAVAPTIPGQCSDAFFSGCVRLARDYGVGLHTHLAESKVQAIASQQRWGKTLVGHLADLGALDSRFVGAHGVWLTDDDIRQLADAGAAVAHNPASNLKLGCGIAPVREMVEQGLTVGLGTDGAMSSDNLNLFEAMRFAALVGKVRFPMSQRAGSGRRRPGTSRRAGAHVSSAWPRLSGLWLRAIKPISCSYGLIPCFAASQSSAQRPRLR